MTTCINCGCEIIKSGNKRVRLWGHKAIAVPSFKPVAVLECLKIHKKYEGNCIYPEPAKDDKS